MRHGMKIFFAFAFAACAVFFSSTAVFASAAQPADATAKIATLQNDLDKLKAERAALTVSSGDLGPLPDANGNEKAEVAAAQNLPPDEYAKGVVQAVSHDASGGTTTYGILLVNGKEKGQTVSISEQDLDIASSKRELHAGDAVVVVKSYQVDGTIQHYIADNDRLMPLVLMALLFFVIAGAFGGKRGVTSVAGLAVTVAIIIWFVVPRIAAGSNPLTVCIIAAFAIAALSLYLAHGFNVRTSIAFVSTTITLAFSAWMATAFVSWTRLYGMGSEDAIFLQGGSLGNIDLRGLLLGGIILGVLGILDDITTAQAAIVDELKHANPRFRFNDLYKRGISVGREHIASLINTLFLAYAGVSLPLFLLFSVNRSQPLWFIVNSEAISEEIVRTLVGSICLILAVPITTALAASFYDRRKTDPREATTEAHHHH
jgi:uncharacterized membrane protein